MKEPQGIPTHGHPPKPSHRARTQKIIPHTRDHKLSNTHPQSGGGHIDPRSRRRTAANKYDQNQRTKWKRKPYPNRHVKPRQVGVGTSTREYVTRSKNTANKSRLPSCRPVKRDKSTGRRRVAESWMYCQLAIQGLPPNTVARLKTTNVTNYSHVYQYTCNFK